MADKLIISVDLGKPCQRCGKAGAMQNGICLNCMTKGIQQGEFDHILKPLSERTRKKLRRKRSK